MPRPSTYRTVACAAPAASQASAEAIPPAPGCGLPTHATGTATNNDAALTIGLF